MIVATFKRPRSPRLIYGCYKHENVTPREVIYFGQVYYLYGILGPVQQINGVGTL
jgi:hypothetical protein